MKNSLPILFFVVMLLLFPFHVQAEGPLSGGTRVYIANEPLGPFEVTSFAAPNPPITTDRLWVSAQIRDGTKAVTDAKVWITVTSQITGESQRQEAVHDLAATPLDYTAALDVKVDGKYEVLIEMSHAQGDGQISYLVHVSEPLTNAIFLGMAGPAILIALFLVHRFMFKLPAPMAILAGDDEPLLDDLDEREK